MITFDEKNHKYYNEDGIEYTSVTTLLSRKFEFNQKEIAEKVSKCTSSKYFGMSVERILDYWEASSGHGNVVHEAVENYIKYKKYPDDSDLIPLVEQFAKLKFTGKLLSEQLIWDDKYRIAGTADILEDCGDKIFLYDIKTSARITEDKLMKFSMQFELYKRLAQNVFKKPVHITSILHFDDFVVRRKNTKLKLLQPLRCAEAVDDILKERLVEICKSR